MTKAFSRQVFVRLWELPENQPHILRQLVSWKLPNLPQESTAPVFIFLCTFFFSLLIYVPSLQSPVRHDICSNWLTLCYLTRLWIEGMFWASFLCRMITLKMRNALTSATLIFKERLIVIHESSICMPGKTTCQWK